MAKSSADRLSAYVKPLDSLSALFLYLGEVGNDRLTTNQAAFFLLAAAGDARGRPMTMGEILEHGALNPSLANTYKVLLENPGREHENIALGWLYREVDEDDRRRSYLRLTENGRAVAKTALLCVGMNPLDKDADHEAHGHGSIKPQASS